MPTKYKAKQPKPITKQMSPQRELSLYTASLKYAVCTNCGRTCSTITNEYSKCKCGGTYQTYKVLND